MLSQGPRRRCYLKGREGDAANVILTAAGYNLRLVLAWLRILLRLFLFALCRPLAIPPTIKAVPASLKRSDDGSKDGTNARTLGGGRASQLS